MKKITIFTILFFSLFTSCSDSKKDSEMILYFKDIQIDHSEWVKIIENVINDSIPRNQLSGLYFFNNQKTTFERRDVGHIMKYFDLNTTHALFHDYTKLIDRKGTLEVGFYRCRDVTDNELMELIKIENEIIAVLNKIEKEIDNL